MNTLEDLIDALGKEKVDSLLMEYLLLQLSKAMKCDQLAKAIESGKDMDQLKEMLYE